jgi:hypothetical protein
MEAKLTWLKSQNSDTTAPSGRELYHLQFLLQAASPETFGYILVFLEQRCFCAQNFFCKCRISCAYCDPTLATNGMEWWLVLLWGCSFSFKNAVTGIFNVLFSSITVLRIVYGRSCNSSVSVVTRLRAGRPGFSYLLGQKWIFFFSRRHRVQTCLGSQPAFFSMATVVSPGGIATRASSSPPTSV